MIDTDYHSQKSQVTVLGRIRSTYVPEGLGECPDEVGGVRGGLQYQVRQHVLLGVLKQSKNSVGGLLSFRKIREIY